MHGLTKPEQALREGREKIDSISCTIVELISMGARANNPLIRGLLRMRTESAVSIGDAKKALGINTIDTSREAEVMRRAMAKACEVGANRKRVELLMHIAIRSARRAQNRIG